MKFLILLALVSFPVFAKHAPRYKHKQIPQGDLVFDIQDPPTPMDDAAVRSKGFVLCEVPRKSGNWTVAKDKKACGEIQGRSKKRAKK